MTDTCPSCGYAKYRVLPYGGYRYKGKNMPLVRCDSCLLMYVIHGLTESDFNEFYNDNSYFDSEYAGGVELDYASNMLEMKKKAETVLSKIYRFAPKGRFLDIGCAGGYLLEVARDTYKYQVAGIEVSEKMSQEGKARGLDIFCGTIDQFPKTSSPFDVVYMGDVLEHVPNPKKFMLEVKSQMNDRSFMALELPLTYNLTLSGLIIGAINMLKGRFGYEYFLPAQHRHGLEDKPPYHVLMFSRGSIKNFFWKEGFVIRYLKIYEGEPKTKFSGTLYGNLKKITHFMTFYLPQNFLGDRMIVIAQKI